MNSVIIVDKPAGWTSHDVVARMRRILQQRSIGHLGTLDPLATGVLPLVTGSFTRLAQFYISSEKTYEGVIRFGFATNTYDADGERMGEISGQDHVGTVALGCPMANLPLDMSRLQTLAAKFIGHIQQIPPPFSAKKINGVPAYKFARKQKEVVLKPVRVEIKEFAITSVDADRAHFRARVSSGTYMRSIAHEMGQLLGCGAHLASLRRTSVAEFNISQSHTIEEIETIAKRCHSDRSFAFPRGKGSEVEEPAVAVATQPMRGGRSLPPLATSAHHDLATHFLHPRQLLPHLPSVTADESTAALIRHGRSVNLPEMSRAPLVKVFASQAHLLAIATRIAGTLFRPKIVFPQD
jgi:tRNA pseudouridine55 synthase